MDLPLAGLRVLSLEQAIAVPLCTRYLADMGADVIKIERPEGGDFARQYDSAAGENVSSWFVWANRGKRSLALDMKQPESLEIVHKLLAHSDIFLQNLAPGAAERLGLGVEALRQKYPRLIICTLSGYGLSGPYRDRKAYDLLLQGEAGVYALTGTADDPMKAGISVSDIAAGLYCFSSILLALRQRDTTGQGNVIETSLLDSTVEWVAPYLYYSMYTGRTPQRSGSRHNVIVPYGLYRAKNGSVNLAVQNEEQWRRLCRVALVRPDIASDPRYDSNEKRVARREELEALIEEIFSELTVEELEKRLEEADVPFGRVNSLETVAQHPQLRAQGRFSTLQVPDGRMLEALVSPFGLVNLPRELKAVPAAGQHNSEILRELEEFEA
ncbi:MAG: CoA transferase [Chloroflexi bacterium]|uniref:CoA transferase n=1 Tax=Candidatus Chlorohelix allophototropha TaxID=3003348 RepID=A0A8T7M6V9_9CHLR|nr:CoA transferase [Chloroflexota bacterium]WJW69789.1 CoA transferase [Chloroflexota bacterium L227-S17]